MRIIEAIAVVLEALAWPAAAVIIVLLTRKHLPALIPRLKRLKAGPVEIELAEMLERVEEQADAASLPPARIEPKELAEVEEVRSYLIGISTVGPRAALVEAWTRLERTLRRVASNIRPDVPNRLSEHLRVLRNSGALTAEMIAVIEDLRSLRNKAVHHATVEVSPTLAKSFIDLLVRVVAVLRTFERKRSPEAELVLTLKKLEREHPLTDDEKYVVFRDAIVGALTRHSGTAVTVSAEDVLWAQRAVDEGSLEWVPNVSYTLRLPLPVK